MIVTPRVGMYVVSEDGKQARSVTKGKLCSCGGDRDSPCKHIKAVRDYLLAGGERAEMVERPLPLDHERVRECPVCNAKVKWAGSYTYPLMWRCPHDSSHFWQWYGELHHVRECLTGGRLTGIPGIDTLSSEEYEEWLEARRR
jgi:hypothetical protein